MDMATSGDDLRARIGALRWYHTIDLGNGLVTPGWFDTRPTVAKVPMPASLEGKRCLDVGTWDGFWAFEMEKRGADSVTAIDVQDQDRWDWPPIMRMRPRNTGREVVAAFKEEGAAFNLAHEILQSKVKRLDQSVYDLSPEQNGTFDFVFLGSLLLHLRDPVAALAALRTVCSAEAVIADTIDLWPSLTRPRTPTARLDGVERPWWWIPNRAGFHQMLRSAGFEILDTTPIYLLPRGSAHPRSPWRAVPKMLRTAAGRENLVVAAHGIPHAAARVRPAQV
ncbi:MAG: methyltransferase domain-containing protein [Solirubrobacteraceae bacterium]